MFHRFWEHSHQTGHTSQNFPLKRDATKRNVQKEDYDRRHNRIWTMVGLYEFGPTMTSKLGESSLLPILPDLTWCRLPLALFAETRAI